MKLSASMLAVINTAAHLTATVGAVEILQSGLRHLPESASDSNEICFNISPSLSPSDVALLRSIARHLADDSWTGVTRPGDAFPDYALGCGFLDFKCNECDLCEGIYGTLVSTGSTVACTESCIAIVEAAGGGPEDPIADAVAAACLPMCLLIFQSAGGSTAQSVCTAVGFCKSDTPSRSWV